MSRRAGQLLTLHPNPKNTDHTRVHTSAAIVFKSAPA